MRTYTRRLASMLAAATLSIAIATPAHAQSSIDHLGRPAPYILEQMEAFAARPFIPEGLRNSILATVAFYRGDGKGGVPLPDDAPIINQFSWPTVSASCIDSTLTATGAAIAIPGPANLPLPGTPAGQATFVFTALGTSQAADQQRGMFVHWLNLNNGRFGRTQLTKGTINLEGPATLSGIADTGRGQVLAWLGGSVTLADATGAPTNTCNFSPTANSFFVN